MDMYVFHFKSGGIGKMSLSGLNEILSVQNNQEFWK